MPGFEEVRRCAGELHTVNIVYSKDTGEVKTYTLEPYSVRGEFFFGYDVIEGSIKKFRISGIIDVIDTGEMFTPREGWLVEF